MQKSKRYIIFLCISLLAAVLAITDIATGSVYIPLQTLLQTLLHPGNSSTDIIILQSRLPRVITAVLVGMALPAAGLLMQTYFKNPVAGPDILGITSGASLAVALSMMGAGVSGYHIFSASGSIGIILAGIVGSLVVLIIMLSVARKISDSVTLLIFGIMLGMAISAAVGLLQYFSEKEALKLFVLWTFGSLNGVTWAQLSYLTPVIFIAIVLAFATSKSLNILLLGEEYAKSLGLQTRRMRVILIGITGLLTGAVTAFCGPIAFIGIAVPHLARMIFKTSDHFILLPASILCGICIMIFCDIICQLPGYDIVLPVNTITALMGAPFVIYILMKNNTMQRFF